MVVKDLEFGPSLGESSLFPKELWALPLGKFIVP